MIWTFVASLIAGLFAGVYSGLLVMRKTTYDSKRQSAKQMHKALGAVLNWTLLGIHAYMHHFGVEVVSVDAKPNMPFSLEAAMTLLTESQQWWHTKSQKQL